MTYRRASLVRFAALVLALTISACTHKPTREELARDVNADFQDISSDLLGFAKTHGHFPATLLEASQKVASPIDWLSIDTPCRRYYGYAVSTDGLVVMLVSVGFDGQPNTSDDLVRIVDNRSPPSAKLESDLHDDLLRRAYATSTCVPVDRKQN